MNTHQAYLLFILLLGYFSLLAQPGWEPGSLPGLSYRFEAIGAEQGLPQNTVNTLFQDHLGFIWLGTPAGLVRYDGYKFQTYQYEKQDTISDILHSIKINVNTIAEDTHGDLWIGCLYERDEKPVLFRFERETEKLIPYLFESSKSLIKNTVQDIHLDQDFLWLVTPKLFRIRLPVSKPDDQQGEGLTYEEMKRGSHGLKFGRFSNIYQDSKGRMWLPTWMGVQEWIASADTFQFHALPLFPKDSGRKPFAYAQMQEAKDGWIWAFPALSGQVIRFRPEDGSREVIRSNQYFASFSSVQTSSGEIWLGRRPGRGGITVLDPIKGKLIHINLQVDGSIFSPNTRVLSMLRDFSGNIWVATEHGSLLKYEPQRDQFHWLQFQADDKNSLSHNWVNDVKQDQNGHYWITTFGGGLNKWDREKNKFTHFRAQKGNLNLPLSDYLKGLSIKPDGKIWFGEGFAAASYQPSSGIFRHYRESGTVMTAYHDAQDRLWLAKAGGGLRLYDPIKDDFKVIGLPDPKDSTKNRYVMMGGIFQDSQGKLWLGSHSPSISGFFRYDPATEKFETFELPEAHAFCEDRHGNIWIGSVDGLYRYDPKEKSFFRYGEREGLPNASVRSLHEDDIGRLWMGTDNGLSCFNPEENSFRNYFQSDGLPANDFIPTSYKNKAGELFFGGTFGLLYFHPDSIQDNSIPPKLAFTGIDLYGLPIPITTDGPLKKHVSLTQQINFSHDQNDLTIHFTALHFKNPQKNQYQIWLENYDPTWQNKGAQNTATYTNLDPGNYTFRVKAANSDGLWSEEDIALDITIASPWYWNIWSKSLYLLAISGLILGFYNFQLKRQLAVAEAERLREFNQVRNKLYTNITHEFRTPLTVIQGTTERIDSHWEEKEIILRNSQNLLGLVNSMLDLAKLEAGKLPLKLIHADILHFLRYVTESFHALALNEKISLNFYSDVDKIEMDYDPEKILQILSNLISNAIKFNREYGKINIIAREKVITGQPTLSIQVEDTGIGIAADELVHIFDRFYQLDDSPTRPAEGTGIGLSLVKELVSLMHGEISVESQVGEGTTFRVLLPIRHQALSSDTSFTFPIATGSIVNTTSPERIPNVSQEEILPETIPVDLPLLLIVEDNRDVREYLDHCLRSNYQLYFARNGREGIEQALKYIPDIIISDIMMPEVDGFELCQTLKEDKRTDHIPIILLTAKADIDSRLEGLEFGADAYLVKPFQRQELDIRLRKLTELRQKLQIKYNQPEFEIEPKTKKEDIFVTKAKQLVLDNLDDPNFGIQELSQALLLHRSQLYRKLMGLVGKSPTHFIRDIRLQQGYRLLKERELNVTEVALEVGFSDLAYFSKLFKQKYGQSPSVIQKK